MGLVLGVVLLIMVFTLFHAAGHRAPGSVMRPLHVE